MHTKLKTLTWILVPLILLASPFVLYRVRYVRTAVITDLSTAHTQTVSIAFLPDKMDWKVSGQVQGAGIILISHVFSNRVTGHFSARSGGDYYSTNVSLIFLPEGGATGKVRASFDFSSFP